VANPNKALVGGEEQAKGEGKSNRNNPRFKNRRNSLTTNEKTFSNRNKNTCFALPSFRPPGARRSQPGFG
jgi:hypothetical protein